MKNCYICESERVFLLKNLNQFCVYKCKHCGLVWINDVSEEEIYSFYNHDYFNNNTDMGYKNYVLDEENHRKNFRKLIKQVMSVCSLQGKKIIEIGSAYGYLLDELRQINVDSVYGVEFNVEAYNYSKNILLLDVENGDLKDSSFKTMKFDVVFLVGVIEHLTSPRDTLIEIKKILNPGGVLLITTINTNGWVPIYKIKPPEHLFYFNKRNLSLLLNELGFEVLKVRTYFVNYRLHDIFRRVGVVTSKDIFYKISEYLERKIPNLSFSIPSPEMIMIAKLNGKGEGEE